MLNREKKAEEIAALSSNLVRAKSVFLVRFLGMSVEDSTAIRKDLRQVQSEIKVVKNTLFRKALKEVSEIDSALGEEITGPNAVVFSYEDPSASAKIIANKAKDVEALEVRMGFMDGTALSAADIEKLATLPGKDELRAKLLSVFKAPMSKTVRLFNEVPTSFVRTLNAKSQKGA